MATGMASGSEWRLNFSPWRWLRERLVPLAAVALAIAVTALNLLGARDDSASATSHSAIEVAMDSVTLDEGRALEGDAAKRFCTLLLAEAGRKLKSVDTIQATFHKRERVDGELQELNVMRLKVRRQPLSVYMRWQVPDEGREIIWQEDANDGMIVLHAGGWRRKLVPFLKLDPTGDRAMQYSRRPVSSIGLWNFNARLVSFLDDELARPQVTTLMTQDARLCGRPCYCFRFVNPQPVSAEDPHKVMIYIDQTLSVPVALEMYSLPTGGDASEPVLEESYAFNDLQLHASLNDADFDTANPHYQFGKP